MVSERGTATASQKQERLMTNFFDSPALKKAGLAIARVCAAVVGIIVLVIGIVPTFAAFDGAGLVPAPISIVTAAYSAKQAVLILLVGLGILAVAKEMFKFALKGE
jgi:hypothetical protein